MISFLSLQVLRSFPEQFYENVFHLISEGKKYLKSQTQFATSFHSLLLCDPMIFGLKL